MEVHLLLNDQEDFLAFLSALKEEGIEYELGSVEGGSEFEVTLTLFDADDLSTLLIAHPSRLLSARRLVEPHPITTSIVTIPYPVPPLPQPWPPGVWYGDGTPAAAPSLYVGDPIPNPVEVTCTSDESPDVVRGPVTTPTVDDVLPFEDSGTRWHNLYAGTGCHTVM